MQFNSTIKAFFISGLIFLSLSLMIQFTDFDLFISNLFYLEQKQQFILQSNKLGRILHDYPKYLSILIGLTFVFQSLSLIIKNKKLFPFSNKQIYFVSLMFFMVPLVINALRYFSLMHCPRDLIIYGGMYDYLRIFDTAPMDWQAGQCSPSAHAGSFLPLVSIVFIMRYKISKALIMYALIFLLTSVQILRGAHFFSHIVFSILIANVLIFIVADWMKIRQSPRPQEDNLGL